MKKKLRKNLLNFGKLQINAHEQMLSMVMMEVALFFSLCFLVCQNNSMVLFSDVIACSCLE